MTQRPLSPRSWPTWLFIGLLRLASLLPWALQRRMGSGLGYLLFALPTRFKKIVFTNLSLCLPDNPPPVQQRLAAQHFQDLGISLFESALTWWGKDQLIDKLADIEGIDHLRQAHASGRGVILTTYHSTTLSIGARILNRYFKLTPLYRPTKDRVIAYVSAKSFERHAQATILHTDMRRMIQQLKRGHIVWYIADQNYRRTGAVRVPFFNIPAATNAFAPRLADMTNSAVIFYTCVRRSNGRYSITIYPPLQWRGVDELTAMKQYHQLIESSITQSPSQYWWVHKRFKPLDDSDIDYYQNLQRH
jgi:Kdo2-lipid IVA lauroyltransferase/acyltransferase